MKEELTTAMHAEFTVSQESDNELRALSLLERERDGTPVTDEKENWGIGGEAHWCYHSKFNLYHHLTDKEMLQVGKSYSVVEPERAWNLGGPKVVKILKEEKGMFLGDNEIWYLPNGRHRIDDPLGAADSFHLIDFPID